MRGPGVAVAASHGRGSNLPAFPTKQMFVLGESLGWVVNSALGDES